MTDHRNDAVPALAARLLADGAPRGAGVERSAAWVGERFVA